MTRHALNVPMFQRMTETALRDDEIRAQHLAPLAETAWPCVNLLDDYPGIRDSLFKALGQQALDQARKGYNHATVVIAMPQYPEASKQRVRLRELLCADIGAPLEMVFYSGRKNDCRAPGVDGAALQATLRW